MSKLINIYDERFWDILFDGACVEGNQAERIKNELEKIVAFDTEQVIHNLECEKTIWIGKKITTTEVMKIDDAIDIVKNGGVE